MRSRPTRPTKHQRRRPPAAALALAGLGFVVVAIAMASGPTQNASLDGSSQFARLLPEPQQRPAREPALLPPATTPPRPEPAPPQPRVWAQMPPPKRLSIPAIGISAPIVALGRNADGTMETPDNVVDTGWFAPGPEPGEKGAAVIAGHVDSYEGPGVFYRLRALQRGDRITITLRGGRKLRFVVSGLKEAPKDEFPTKLVFAQTARPTLRLITCGGAFNRSTGHYVDNYIVFAQLLGHL